MVSPTGASRRRATLGRADEALELALVHEHAPRLRALVARDDAAALEHVDQPAGPRVADAQAALDEADRRGLRLHDHLDGPVEQRILVRIELAVVLVEVVRERLGGLEQRLVELLRPLVPALLDDERDLVLAHVGTLDALEPRGAERLEEHVALAEEALRARAVEDDARVRHARDRER